MSHPLQPMSIARALLFTVLGSLQLLSEVMVIWAFPDAVACMARHCHFTVYRDAVVCMAWHCHFSVYSGVYAHFYLLVRASGIIDCLFMTMIQKCWTGIWEMNKYESTRGGMQSLDLFMTLMTSYCIKKSNRKIVRGLPKLIPRLVVAVSASVVGISGRTVSKRIPMPRILLFLAVSKVNRFVTCGSTKM
jgi:hypothetical protein